MRLTSGKAPPGPPTLHRSHPCSAVVRSVSRFMPHRLTAQRKSDETKPISPKSLVIIGWQPNPQSPRRKPGVEPATVPRVSPFRSCGLGAAGPTLGPRLGWPQRSPRTTKQTQFLLTRFESLTCCGIHRAPGASLGSSRECPTHPHLRQRSLGTAHRFTARYGTTKQNQTARR